MADEVETSFGDLAGERLVPGASRGATDGAVLGQGLRSSEPPVEQGLVDVRRLAARARVEKEALVLLVLVPDIAPAHDPAVLQRDPEVGVDVEQRRREQVADLALALASTTHPLELPEELGERGEVFEGGRPDVDHASSFSKVTLSLSTCMPARS